jgi:hypothetical protein
MLSATFRRATAALAGRSPDIHTRVRKRYTSWTTFEQPNASSYATVLKVKATLAGSPEETQKETSTRSLAAAPLNTITRNLAAGIVRVPSQLQGESSHGRPYTQFRTEPWRDSSLPNLRIDIIGSPATFGVMNAMDSLHRINLARANYAPTHNLVFAGFPGEVEHGFEKLREKEMREAELWHDIFGMEEERKEKNKDVFDQRNAQEKRWGNYQNMLKDNSSV